MNLTKHSPASIIYQQLGGGRFTLLTGSHSFIETEDGYTLKFYLQENKIQATYLEIHLTAMDDYTLTFFDDEGTWIERREGVYDDMLQEMFTVVTGLLTTI